MLELLNIRFGFSCRTGHKNAEGKSPIFLHVIFRGERRDLFTGIFCFSMDWDTANDRVFRKDKAATTLNDNLAMILKSAQFDLPNLPAGRQYPCICFAPAQNAWMCKENKMNKPG